MMISLLRKVSPTVSVGGLCGLNENCHFLDFTDKYDESQNRKVLLLRRRDFSENRSAFFKMGVILTACA